MSVQQTNIDGIHSLVSSFFTFYFGFVDFAACTKELIKDFPHAFN